MRGARRTTMAAVVLWMSAGCGEEEPSAPAVPAARTDLTVEIRPEGEGPARTFRVRCPGDARCARLERGGTEPFAAVAPTTACTEIFGGPETASVRGTLAGERVEARFSRTNGCEIARWDGLDFLLRPSP